MPEAIQPLRIQKSTPLSSPTKMNGHLVHRPLAELGSTERRRNSPSYNQSTKNAVFNENSSPFDTSPATSNSPRLYWQSRDSPSSKRLSTENESPFGHRDVSPSPAKRSSIENLKRASRVKNSNMFAREHKQEYDPASSPQIERPLASGRPLGLQSHGNAYGGRGLENFRNGAQMASNKLPHCSPANHSTQMNGQVEYKSPTKGETSPTKSSLSSRSRYAKIFDPENGIWSDDEDVSVKQELPPGKSLHRHAKSVTFDAAPPQVNEYEMTTPDPSSVASGSREGSYESAENEEDESFDHGSSVDRDDSFDDSLEDADKTPVVLPEDWRFMSPGVANEELAARIEDPFDGEHNSPAPATAPMIAKNPRPSPARTDSVNSNGERRPLPPLPALNVPFLPRPRSDSNNSFSAIAERIGNSQRNSPSLPRPASISKAEIQGLGGCSMSIEDRLKLMMLQEEERQKSPAEEQREKKLRHTTTSPEPEMQYSHEQRQAQIHEHEAEGDDVTDLGEYKLPPRISRESILRKVKTQMQQQEDEQYDYYTPESDYATVLDPDTPIPSLEDPSAIPTFENGIVIKQEDGEESEVDVYSIPDMYSQRFETDTRVEIPQHEAFGHYTNQSDTQKEDDDASHYSNDSTVGEFHEAQSRLVTEDDGIATPRAGSPQHTAGSLERKDSRRMSLPQFASLLAEQDFQDLGFGLEPYMTPSPPLAADLSKAVQHLEPIQKDKHLNRPVTPEEKLQPPTFPGQTGDSLDEPRTPDSVIRHPVPEAPLPESPGIPEPIATIKAPGSKLKTRPSITPADVRSMAETRRQFSSELPTGPSIPEKDRNGSGSTVGTGLHSSRLNSNSSRSDTGSMISSGCVVAGDPMKKRKSSLLPLELGVSGSDDGLGFGLDKEFDRVIEAQKVAFNFPSVEPQPLSPGCAEYIGGQGFRPIPEGFANRRYRTQKGYLMRQNTKVVVASSASHESASENADTQEPSARGTRSAGNSPRKPSATQTWTTEPWNGKVRRKSLRQSVGSPNKRSSNGPAPPLPGQSSNVTSGPLNGLGSVAENEVMSNPEEIEEGGERGRLFVKVVCVKDLDLPLPRGERSYFTLTLDNGLHCVTTAWLELGKTAPIGQEFELVVLNDLEFQLTLQTKLEEPRVKPVIESPTKSIKTPKTSTFSRVFASSKKRKELELKQQEEAQRVARQQQEEAQAKKRSAQPTAWDLLHGLVAKDGSFARSYISLSDHESKAYGRPYVVDIPCFNEWATEEKPIPSVKSKHSTMGGAVQKKPPYRIGKLELQLLYVPKLKGSNDDDMPKSMNACIRDLAEAEVSIPKSWEGHLSQQGGDCPYWRRRFFKLQGSKLTAYHEATRQPRATINLAKASKLIDDKSALMRKETSGKGGSRRKSAFAEEEEGYMFVEEGFRVRFANGETIDFYADSAAQKDEWMKALSEVVGKDMSKPRTWTDLVLAREKALALAAGGKGEHLTTKSATSSPVKRDESRVPPPVEKDARHAYGSATRAREVKTRSMIF